MELNLTVYQMTGTNNKTDELGHGNIKKLLWHYSLPAIAAMSAASLYNIIDRVLIGQNVGSMAIAGLAITFPVVNLAAAFGSLVGSGAATMISLRLGAQKQPSATRYLGNSLINNCIVGFLVTVLGLIFLNPIL
jgi:Na+-driven multidrug efflux pump